MEQEKEIRTLKKTEGKDKYVLHIVKPATDSHGRLETIQEFNKKQLKGVLDMIITKRENAATQKTHFDKQLKNSQVEDNKALRDFIEMMDKAKNIDSKKHAEESLEFLNADLDEQNRYVKEIKFACPELFRDGKK